MHFKKNKKNGSDALIKIFIDKMLGNIAKARSRFCVIQSEDERFNQ